MESLLDTLKYMNAAFFDIRDVDIEYKDRDEWTSAVDRWFDDLAFQCKAVLLPPIIATHTFAFNAFLGALLYSTGKFVVGKLYRRLSSLPAVYRT